jgi:hypothetical protein
VDRKGVGKDRDGRIADNTYQHLHALEQILIGIINCDDIKS